MREYRQVLPISISEAEDVFSSGDPARIATALVSIAFYESDWKWAQDKCLEHLFHSDEDISGLAATCLGHIARVHGKLEKAKVLNALKRWLSCLPIVGRIEDALQDIDMYIIG